MARPKAILQSDFPYNITARCINKEWFNLPIELVWEIFCDELSRTIKEKNLVVHSFVLMANHFHLVASTPEANISQCMHQFMSRTSRLLTRNGNRINETFAGRHHKCILNNNFYFLNAYKYNYGNPVKAEICKKVEDYKFSTLRGLIDCSEKKVPICGDSFYLENPTGVLNWLNTEPSPLKLEAFRNGLRHQYFKSALTPNGKAPLISETELL